MLAGESRADPPELAQAARDVGRAGLDAGREAWSVFTTFRRLLAADLTLSRSALGMTLAWIAGTIILGASAWIFFMGAAVLALRDSGLSLLWALLLPAVLSAIGAGVCGWLAMRVYEHTSLDATRRQLARFGLAGDPEQDKNPETGTEPAAEDRPPEPEPKAPPPAMSVDDAAEPPPPVEKTTPAERKSSEPPP
jgi:hypothetical protein